MLQGFERETHDLTDYEMDILLPIVVKGLATKIGKPRAVTNKVIVEKLKARGLKINDARVRKLINHIRNHNLIPGLVASSDGYYIAHDPVEIRRYIESLDGREAEIRRIKLGMKNYLKQILSTSQTYLNLGQ